jgi:LacI family transcriptional regulator
VLDKYSIFGLMEVSMVNQRDVAKRAKVSFITVSRVINDKENVKPETRERVLKAIEELNYHPNSLGRALNFNRMNNIGVIIPTEPGVSIHGTHYYNELMIGIELACTAHAYDMQISTQKYKATGFNFLKLYYERKVDGIILVAPPMDSPQMKEIEVNNIPCVVINERFDKLKISYVDNDSKGGMILATEYLFQKGHQKIAFLKGSPGHNSQDRFEGFQEAMYRYGIPIVQDWVIQGDFTVDAGKAALRKLLDKGNLPTAILCANDLMALGVFMEAKKAGIKIPDDLSVMGYDSIDAAKYTNPALTTVKQPVEDMGYIATEMLIQQLNSPNYSPEVKIFPVELIPGESVKGLR